MHLATFVAREQIDSFFFTFFQQIFRENTNFLIFSEYNFVIKHKKVHFFSYIYFLKLDFLFRNKVFWENTAFSHFSYIFSATLKIQRENKIFHIFVINFTESNLYVLLSLTNIIARLTTKGLSRHGTTQKQNTLLSPLQKRTHRTV